MDKVVFYRDHSPRREWRWRVYAPNGHIIGASSEGYGTRARAIRNYERIVGVWIIPEDLIPAKGGFTVEAAW